MGPSLIPKRASRKAWTSRRHQHEARPVRLGFDGHGGLGRRRRVQAEGQLLRCERLPQQEQRLYDGQPRLACFPSAAEEFDEQILCNYGIFLAILTSRLLIAVFFGTLRAIELERLHDRLWFTVTETLLALAMFRDEFDAGFVVMFVSLILIKCFHWLASDRVEWVSTPFLTRI